MPPRPDSNSTRLSVCCKRVGQVRSHGKRAAAAHDPDRLGIDQQGDGVIERRTVQIALELLHAGNAAADEFIGDIGTAQAPLGLLDDTPDAHLVVAARRDLLGNTVAKDLLHLGVAAETETLGKPDHRRWLHFATLRHILNPVQPDVVPVLFDIAGNLLELPAQGPRRRLRCRPAAAPRPGWTPAWALESIQAKQSRGVSFHIRKTENIF